MTLFEIVGLYTALNLILAPILMFRVGQARMKEKVSLGDGNNDFVLSRIRAHGNFIENAPLFLVGLLVLAGLSAVPVMLHILGGAFTFGRVAHAHGMTGPNALGKGRTIGTLLSVLSYFIMALYILYLVLIG